jgi:hypothetical protein
MEIQYFYIVCQEYHIEGTPDTGNFIIEIDLQCQVGKFPNVLAI